MTSHSRPSGFKKMPQTTDATGAQTQSNQAKADQAKADQAKSPADGDALNPLQQYADQYEKILSIECPPNPTLREGLQLVQQELNLSDEAVERVEAQVSRTFQFRRSQQQQQLDHYKQEYLHALDEGYPFSETVQDHLHNLRNSLGLKVDDVLNLEQQAQVEHAVQAVPLAELEPDHAPLFQPSPPEASPISFPTSPPAAPPTAPPQSQTFQQVQTEQQPHAYDVTLPPEELPDYSDADFDADVLAYDTISPAAEEPSYQPAIDITPVVPEPIPVYAVSSPAAVSPGYAVPPTIINRSERGIDYGYLEACLQRQQWKEADAETFSLMIQAAGQGSVWLDEVAIATFPLTDLRTINQLWTHYSEGRFGFKRQLSLFYGSEIPDANSVSLYQVEFERSLNFAKQAGWWFHRGEFLKYYKMLDFNAQAPDGQFPARWFWVIPWWKALSFGGVGRGRGGTGIDSQALTSFMGRLRESGIWAT